MGVHGHMQLLLEALQYPGASNFTIKGIDEFRALVYGLEDKYVSPIVLIIQCFTIQF